MLNKFINLKCFFLMQRPHQCHLCSHKNYASKGDLAKHLSRVHRDSIHKCDQCNEGFRLKSELRDHYKVHYLEDQDDDDEQNEEEYEVMSEEFIE